MTPVRLNIKDQTDCVHGNLPEQCATCLKKKGAQPQEPTAAAINGPRPLPGPVVRTCARCKKSFKTPWKFRSAAFCSPDCRETYQEASEAIRARVRKSIPQPAPRVTKPPRPEPGLSLSEAVLAALRQSAQPVFTREDIVVLAFRAYPERFGMRTFPEHPCSAKVFALIDGERGLVKRGLLAKTKDGYELPKE